MVANPNMSMYVNNPKALTAAVKFNIKYTGLLKSLENVFNGYADQLQAAIDLMFTLFPVSYTHLTLPTIYSV